MLRSVLTIIGSVLFLLGVFFALQGAGIIMWPAGSFMLADGSWVGKGLVVALAGAAVILIGRRASGKS